MNHEEFQVNWLPQTMTQFNSLSSEQKKEFVSRFLENMGHQEKYLLQTALPQLLYRDFVKLLPLEILEKIFDFLNLKDVLNCCLVSKHWNKYLNSQQSLWKNHAKYLGMNLSSSSAAHPEYKVEAIRGFQLRQNLKTSQCFRHICKEDLIQAGTWFSTLDHDKGYIAAATCDPSNVNRVYEDTKEKVLIFNLNRDMIVEKVTEIPMFVSVIKLVYPDWVLCGHFDGTITCFPLSSSPTIERIRGHSADVLSLVVNQELDLMVSGSADLSVKFWNLSTRKLITTIEDFSHWIINLELKNASQHQLEAFKNQHILFVMTKEFITCYSWNVAEDFPTTKRYEIPLNPADCLTFKNVFFTPGMQVFGQRIAYVRQLPMFDTHTVGDADLIILDVNNGQMVKSVHINQKIRKLLAVGDRFAIVLLPYVNSRYQNVAVIDLQQRKIIGGCTVPHSRANNPNFTQIAMGDTKWLDGFPSEKSSDLLLALSTAEGALHTVHWHF